MKTGDRMKKLREERGLLQQEVCAALNIEQSTLANYENNRRTPKMDMLVSIANFFNVSTDYLLGRTASKEPSAQPIKAAGEKLTPGEKEHLQKYRALTADHREDIDAWVQHFYEKDSPDEEKRHA